MIVAFHIISNSLFIIIRRYKVTHNDWVENKLQTNKCKLKTEILSYGINRLTCDRRTKNAMLCVQAAYRRCISAELPMFVSLRRKQDVPSKRWYPTITLHSVITQKSTAWVHIGKYMCLTEVKRAGSFLRSGYHSVIQESPDVLCNPMLHYNVHWTVSWVSWIAYTSSHLIYVISITIMSS
jgi:hypothetical protein